MVKDLFLNFAATGPEVPLSPDSKDKTCLGTSATRSPSPKSKVKKTALQEPTKKSVKEYDKSMASHEAAVKKGISELDKAILEFRESQEMRDVQEKRSKDRMARKQRHSDDVAAESRRTPFGFGFSSLACLDLTNEFCLFSSHKLTPTKTKE